MTIDQPPVAVFDKARNIKLLILDVDGVLTDGKLFFDQQGNEYKTFNAQDGHGVMLLRQVGIEVAVISGRKSASVELRMNSLGIERVYQGYKDKRLAFAELLTQLNLAPHETAHVGDDLLDLPIMTRAGLAVAVHDANPTVKQYADWCTARPGGQGAVREVCDLLLKAQGHFDSLLNEYLT